LVVAEAALVDYYRRRAEEVFDYFENQPTLWVAKAEPTVEALPPRLKLKPR